VHCTFRISDRRDASEPVYGRWVENHDADVDPMTLGLQHFTRYDEQVLRDRGTSSVGFQPGEKEQLMAGAA